MAASRAAWVLRAWARAKLLPDKGIHIVPSGDSLVVELPGGGGFGDPKRRSRAMIQADLDAGVVSGEAARTDYGIE